MNKDNKGTLVIIGGAEDKKGKCTILRKVSELSGINDGKVIILAVATDYPSEVGKEYKDIFKKLSVKNIDAIHIETREDANDSDKLKQFENSTSVFFTGGDQLKITSLIGGTKIEKILKESFKKGLNIAGTSAGASVMSKIMITSGLDDDAPKKCTVKMAPGLGFIEDVVIDQHFAQRGRLGRLLSAIAQNPSVLGIGIDEDTAIIVKPDNTFNVLGSNSVTIVDGKSCKDTNVSELHPNETLFITDIKLHILPEGYSFNMVHREPFLRR